MADNTTTPTPSEEKKEKQEPQNTTKHVNFCSTKECGKLATMQCPKCKEKGLPACHFCDQDCFKKSWNDHKIVHKQVKLRANYRYPNFEYTGPLRPHYVSPMRYVPKSIPRPEYAEKGTPVTEVQQRGNTTIHINSKKEIKGIRAACVLGRQILDLAHTLVRPGITTEEIDKVVHEAIVAAGAYPSPLNYHNFPKSCCTSVNEIICHGIPDARPLVEGDIVNVDITVFHKGFHGDLNETFCVGEVDEKSKQLIKATYDSLAAAIKYVKPGVMCREFGKIISKATGTKGYSVVRSYCGHGIGSLFHCAPNIPHYARNKAVGVLKPGMVFTIEPMINMGTWQDVTWPDDWTSATKDGKRSAQFEHTILVTEHGCEVLTRRTKDSPLLFWEAEKQAQAALDRAKQAAKKAEKEAKEKEVAAK